MGRRAHLCKSAGSEKIPKDVRTNHEKWCHKWYQNDLKLIQIHPQNGAGNIKTYHPKYSTLSDFSSHSGPVARFIPRVARFFACDLFIGTSAGHPLDRFWLPLGHPGPIFFPRWKILGAIWFRMSKIQGQISILRKQMAPTKPSQNKQGLKRTHS